MVTKRKILVCTLIILITGIAGNAVCEDITKIDMPDTTDIIGTWVSYYQTEIYPASDSLESGESEKQIVTTISVINFSDNCFNVNIYDGEISEETHRKSGIADFPMAYFGFYKISGDTIFVEVYYRVIDSTPWTGHYCFRLNDNELTLQSCDGADVPNCDGSFWDSPGDPAHRRPAFYNSGTFLRQTD